MATLALSAIGSIFGPAGTFIGGTLGAIIDQTLIFPALAGSSTVRQEGPRLSDLDVSVAAYGSPRPLTLGPQNRVTGTPLWLSELIETKTTKKQKAGGKGGGGQTAESTTYSYSVDVQVGWGGRLGGGAAVAVKRVWADSKLIFGEGADNADPRYRAMRHYLGGAAQTADSYLVAQLGVGNVPAYRGEAYTVIEGLQLADFGNRVPTLRAEVVYDASLSVAAAIGRVLDAAGQPSASYDVSNVVDGCFRGMILKGPTDLVGALRLVLAAYDIKVVRRDGRHYFYDADRQPFAVLPADAAVGILSETDAGRGVVGRLSAADRNRRNAPRVASVRYLDPDRDYQQDARTATATPAAVEETETLDLPLTLSAAEASARAFSALRASRLAATTYSATLPPRYAWIVPGVVVSIVDEAGERVSAEVTRVTRGANFAVELEAIAASDPRTEARAAALGLAVTNPYAGTGGITPGGTIAEVPTVTLLLLDIPPMQDADAERALVYYIPYRADPTQPAFRSGVLYWKNGSDWVVMGALGTEGTVGSVATAAPAPSAFDAVDNVNTIAVQLTNPTASLASVTEAAMLAGDNRAVYGAAGRWEVIGWKTATDNGSGSWTLSGLLRGLRDTHEEAALHASADTFAVLDDGGLASVDIVSPRGTAITFQGVARGGTVDPSGGQTITTQHKTLQPFRPLNVDGEYGLLDGDSDAVLLTWDHQTRRISGVSVYGSSGPVAAADQDERYIVKVYGSGPTLVRTVEVPDYDADRFRGARAFMYTRAMQLDDGTDDTSGTDATFEVLQASTAYPSGGKVAEAGPFSP